jgi:hypothetical protein
VFAGGETIKVKYGHEAEIHGEAAATTLLRLLGYAFGRCHNRAAAALLRLPASSVRRIDLAALVSRTLRPRTD